jgi:hypothetical protein
MLKRIQMVPLNAADCVTERSRYALPLRLRLRTVTAILPPSASEDSTPHDYYRIILKLILEK